MMELARRRAKQKLRMGDLEYQAARGALHKANAPTLGSAPPDQYSQMQEAARGQADATSALSQSRFRDLLDTKGVLDANLNDFYGTQGPKANVWFGTLPPAQAIQQGQQFENGWDQYANIAKAGGLPGQAYETINQAAARRERAQGGGGSLG